MKILRYLQVSLETVIAHKMRSILTMLGIIIGVAAVLTTIGIGRGVANDITTRITSQGTNLLSLSPGASTSGGLSGAGGSANTLTMGDVSALQDKDLHPTLAYVVPDYSANARLVFGNINSQNQVLGTTDEYLSVRNLEMTTGRFLTSADVLEQQRVVVLGPELTADLFEGDNPIGQSIRINGEPFQVVGVLEESGGFGRNNPDNQAFVPIGLAQGRLFNASRYRGEYIVSSVSIEVTSEEAIDEAELQIERTLRLRHALQAEQENDFDLFNQASLLETAADITQTLTLFLGTIGAISLVVGGIGIMNIMLVSVTERTREIGLRKAVGAQDKDILLQFLVEALVLCTLGGLIGVGLSYALSAVFAQIPAITFTVLIELDSLALALGFSLLSGLIFGIYPAIRATQLDPIEALRSE